MTLNIPDAPLRRTMSVWIAAVAGVVIAAVVLALMPTRANAVAIPVPLGTAADFGVLAGSTVTNTGTSVIQGNVGVSPGSAIVGFPPGQVLPPGALHAADAVAAGAQSDLGIAYNQAAGQAPDVTYVDSPHEFGGQTLIPGVYRAPVAAEITGPLTLNAQGNPNAVWVFQIGSSLTTASASEVRLINGASPCNVYWQVGSSATLGTSSTFVGNILAAASITATTGATINGRLLAAAVDDGAVTLDDNTIFQGQCATGGTTGGLVSGGVIAGATTGETTAGTTGTTTVGVIAGVPTGGGTGGGQGGVLGGVLTTGGTTGGVLGGLVAGATTGGVNGGGNGGGNGGVIGGNGDHDHEEKPGKPGDHDHEEKPGRPGDHDHEEKPGKPGDHDHNDKPDEHDGHPGQHGKPGKPGEPEGYGSDHEGHHKKAA
ncbi:ice-binding family protein [Streptomyces sp. NBC_01373]|uniref:ice-binding family protein n=1 Tax=Streptomyces sp. NBC_01373 TaxID=2903843 RepID=UPI002250EC1F|nr:ice-binding family protein [Streptomyces sp. NBC_01373]MCX4700019.1 ice-binding family protein [Streptomyces sp. NBC_01373]